MTPTMDVCLSKELNDRQLEGTRIALPGVLNQGLAVVVECSRGFLRQIPCIGGRCGHQMWYIAWAED